MLTKGDWGVFEFDILAEKVLLFVLLMIPGYVLAKCRKLGEEAIPGMTVMITTVSMPCLVVVKLLEVDIASIGIMKALFCIVHIPLLIITLLFFANRLFKGREVEKFCSFFSNCGFLALPLAAVMFPDKPEVTVYISMCNIAYSILILTLGKGIFSGEKEKLSGILIKPVTVAFVIGVIMSLLKVGEKVPSAVTYTEFFASLTTPLSMTILGYELAHISIKKMFLTPSLYAVAVVKLFVYPLAGFGIILLFDCIPGFDVTPEMSSAIFLATGVSTAALAPALARDCGKDSSLASIITVGTTILSVITLPIMSLIFEMIF